MGGYRAALTIYTQEAFPRDHLRSSRLLGRLLLIKRDWQSARENYDNARNAFLLLFGEEL